MKSYSLIPHVADIRLHVEGSTLAELFEAALEGMVHIMVHAPEKIFLSHSVIDRPTITISAHDLTSLLIDFLSRALTLMHLKKAIYRIVSCEHVDEKSVTARLEGVAVDSFEEDIKAVTYHEALVTKTREGRYQTVVVFDI